MTVETPPEQQPPAASQRCPRCGAAMTEQQEWCLSCGAAVGTRVVAAPGWRTPILVAGVILLLAAIAVAVAIVQLADDTDQVAQEPPPAAATPPASTPTPSPIPTATPEASLTPDPTMPEASGAESPEPATGTADAEWPAGESGWTVVLASDSSEEDAQSKADAFAADAVAGVGILDSDDFSALKPDVYLVFAGRYVSQDAARDALDGIDAPDAYIRRIEPD